jgi:integrase
MAEAYAHDLSDAKYSPSTYNLHRNLLRLVWRVVGEQARCHGNPWDRVTLRKLQAHASRRHALTAGQFTALLDAAERDPDLHDLFMVLAWTGQRLVDAVMLRWGEIDFARGVITLVPRKTARRLGKQVNVPLFPALRPVLDRRQAAQGGVVIPSAQVFPALVSEYLRDRGAALSKRIAAVFNRAGMESSEEREGRAREVCVYGAHSLRHHFVTAAIAAGLPGAMIKSITGHATDDMLEHYQHMGAAQASEFAKLIGAGSGGSVTDGDTKRREPLPAWARTAARKAAEALAAGNTTEATAALAALLS